MKKLPLAALAITLSSLWGCETMTKVDVVNLPAHPLSETKVVKQDKLRVILTEFKDSHGSEEAPDLSSRIFAGEVNKVLRQSGAEMVNMNRAMQDQLKKEIQLLEINGVSDYVPPQAANLAIGGEINSAYVDNEFKDATTAKNFITGDEENRPARCVTTARVAGSVNVYKVNPVSRVDGLNFEGTDSTDTPGSCRELSKAQKRTMLNKALIKGLEKVDGALQTLASSRGSVVSARINPETGKVYFRLSLNPASAKPGANVQFFEMTKFEGMETENVLAEGKVGLKVKSCFQPREPAY